MKNRLILLFLIPISFILTIYAKNNLNFSEYYAIRIYPVLAQIISLITSIFSVSLAEISIILLIILLIIYLIFTVIQSFRNNSSFYLKKFSINILCFVSIIYFLFVLFCGINYYRHEFVYYSGLEIKSSSKEELIKLCEKLIEDANRFREEIKTDENNIVKMFDSNYYETAKRAKISFEKLSEEYNVLAGNYPPPKPVKLSRLMSHSRITGVFFPFTFEANVNIDIPAFQIPATMCHELSHLRGFMREDEANFISYLACINSDYDDFAYSGTMLALTYSMNALYAEDYEAFKKLYDTYSQDVYNDLKYSSAYWKQFETKIAEISNKVNDTYLKANNQIDGVKSYGRMVDLLIAYYNF